MDIIEEIKAEKLIQKHLYKYVWLSGDSTYVYPFMLYQSKDKKPKELTIQLTTNKNVFNKLIERYKSKYKEIDYAYFRKSDGSCPSWLCFIFKEQ